MVHLVSIKCHWVDAHGMIDSLILHFEVHIPAKQLVLVSDLSQQFFVEGDLLNKADDGLLLFALERHSVDLHHFLLLVALYIPLQVIFVDYLV